MEKTVFRAENIITKFSPIDIEQIAYMAKCPPARTREILRGKYEQATDEVMNVRRIAHRLLELRGQ
ncbi:MAG: hypothetical protein SNF92_08195 [Rikenellaceae bacterium]